MTPADRVENARRLRPIVVAFARALSLAAYIDAPLLRSFRLSHRPRADVSVETDLLTSDLVERIDTDAIALRPDVQELFWRELALDRGALDKAWGALLGARSSATPLLRLEERITWRALRNEPDEVERELKTVLAAMLREEGRRRDLAAWCGRALGRLPRSVRDTETAKILATAAKQWVSTSSRIAGLTPSAPGLLLARRIGRERDRVAVSLRRIGDTLEITGPRPPPWVTLEVPGEPLHVIVNDRSISVDPRRVVSVPVSGERVTLGAEDGRRWLLFSHKSTPDLDAMTRFNPRGEYAAVAWLVAPRLAVTSAHAVDPQWRGTLTFVAWSVDARVAVHDLEAGLALLELTYPSEQFEPLATGEARAGDLWELFDAWRGSESKADETRGLIAEAWPTLVLRAPSGDAPERRTFSGMPVFSSGRVIGHLTGKRLSTGEPEVCPSRVVTAWVARHERRMRAAQACVVRLHAGEGRGKQRLAVVVAPGLALTYDEDKSLRDVEVATVTVLGAPSSTEATRAVLKRFDPLVVLELDGLRDLPSLEVGALRGAHGEDALVAGAHETSTTSNDAVEVCAMVLENAPEDPAYFSLRFPEAGERPRADWPGAGGAISHRGVLVGLACGAWDGFNGLPAVRIPDEVLALVQRTTGRGLPVHVHLPVPIATAGLLASVMTFDGSVAHFMTFRTVLGTRYDVTLHVHGEAVEPEFESATHIHVTVLDEDLAAEEFTAALVEGPHLGIVRRWREQTGDGIEVGRYRIAAEGDPAPWEGFVAPERGGVCIAVRRLDGLSTAQACRRAMRFITGLFTALDADATLGRFWHIPVRGIGAMDLEDVASRLRGGPASAFQVRSFDPESELLELSSTRGNVGHGAEHAMIAAQLGVTPSHPSVMKPYRADALWGRFGHARERGGFILDMEFERATVRPTGGASLSGHVRFIYVDNTDTPRSVRVRVSEGVARWAVPPARGLRFPTTVGAILEDAGIALESVIDPP